MDKKRVDLEMCKHTYEQPHMSESQVSMMKQKINQAKMENRRAKKKIRVAVKTAIAAAAVVGLFVALPNTSANIANAMENIPLLGRLVEAVTFRDYQYEDARNHADIEIPEIVVTGNTEEGTTLTDNDSSDIQENMESSANEINAEIQEISESFIKKFESNLQYEEGYQDIIVESQVVNTTPDYFTLKLICYQGAGSGTAWNYYYTIDLNTGERLQLKDLFTDGADYITPISENIKTQMREQMAADSSKYYWLEDEIEEWNFKEITDETEFYVNEDNHIVISFNEGDVAPMYMGVVTFVIPDEVISDIRK